MNWLLLALTGTLLLSASALLQRVLMKEKSSDPYTHSVIFQIICGSIAFLYALIFTGFDLTGISHFIPNIILMTVLFAVGNITLYTSYKLIDAAEVQVLMATSSIWSVLAAVIFLNESLTMYRSIGIASIILGSIIICWRKDSLKLNKGFLYGFATSLLFGFAFANDAYIVKHFNVPSYTTIDFLFPGLLLLILKPSSMKNLSFYANPKRLFKLITVATIYTTAGIVISLAYKSGANVNQVAPISQSSVVLTVIFAYLFLNEKDRTKAKFIGAVLAFIGILLVR